MTFTKDLSEQHQQLPEQTQQQQQQQKQPDNMPSYHRFRRILAQVLTGFLKEKNSRDQRSFCHYVFR